MEDPRFTSYPGFLGTIRDQEMTGLLFSRHKQLPDVAELQHRFRREVVYEGCEEASRNLNVYWFRVGPRL